MEEKRCLKKRDLFVMSWRLNSRAWEPQRHIWRNIPQILQMFLYLHPADYTI